MVRWSGGAAGTLDATASAADSGIGGIEARAVVAGLTTAGLGTRSTASHNTTAAVAATAGPSIIIRFKENQPVREGAGAVRAITASIA
jgi:hypothetical protein